MDSTILHIAFDEGMASFWCVTEKRVLYITDNGYLISEDDISTDEKITVFEVISLHYETDKRTAICGTKRGSIIIFECNYSQKKK